jgi:hypothetical protein
MGLDISAFKLKKFLGTEFTDGIEDNYPEARMIFSMDFKPIDHLKNIKEGVYDVERLKIPSFSMGYGNYNHFRDAICNMANGIDSAHVWAYINKWMGKPFVEFVNFADNEGSFDYEIAEKLYNDFLSHKEKAEKEIPQYFEKYCDYMEILKVVFENKGVVYYC